MTMTLRSEMEDGMEKEAPPVELKNNEFIKLLEENKILFDKSQSPCIQRKKNESIERIQRSYFEKTNKNISPQQIRKRICNMKSEVRKCLRNYSTSKQVRLKEWHKSILQLMDERGDGIEESIGEIPTSTANASGDYSVKPEDLNSDSGDTICDGKYNNNIGNFFLPQINITDADVIAPSNQIMSPYERLTNESEETKNLTNADLERALLLAKYELTVLQSQVVKEQLELIALQKTNIEKGNTTNF